MKFKKIERIHITLCSGANIRGLSGEETTKVKESLTFNNPLYHTVKRYSKYAYTKVPPFLDYFSQSGNVLNVPIGFPFSKYPFFLGATFTDNRSTCRVASPKFSLELREDQRKAAESFIERNETEIAGCVQMPTGKGKSILGLYLASYYSCRTLIVVHKDDLVKQWIEDAGLSFDNKVKVGIIKAQKREVGSFLTVATIQTLNRLSPEALENLYSTFGLVIQDEMHHCPASSFSLVSNFSSRYKLGLTATPNRADGLSHVMNLYFGAFCYKYEHRENDEDILPVHVKVRTHNNVYFNPVCSVKTVGGVNRYTIKDFYAPKSYPLTDRECRISEVPYVRRPQFPHQTTDSFVVESIMEPVCLDILSEYYKGHSCVVFFTMKEHCRKYYQHLVSEVGEGNIAICYGDNKENDEVLRVAESTRKFITLTTYAKSTEGTNVKQWEIAFFVSSMNNDKNVEQAAGRIRRTKEGNKICPALIYDYRTPQVYTMVHHGRLRDTVYDKLKFTSEGGVQHTKFSRGYK